jgi:ATP-dependent RNA helicase SUPV3L1/SUV3
VARLVSGEHVLKPRSILLADEQLTGHARDVVAARIDRFVNHHIATVLKPLDDLTRAEDLDGLARGLAFRLAENLGVLFRRDVADMIKDLDQGARASLRKYGIRFGAYHVFMPALLKPAPAELITLLWALANDGFERAGYGDITPMLAAGRTSVATDPAIDREFYRLAGFRFLGKRAVRIDILERLADLIRPALQWTPGAAGPRPEAAYDGKRFITTTGMLSILGATQDDIEEILKGLGYRADAVQPEEASAHLAAVEEARRAAEGDKPAGPIVEVVQSRTAADRPRVESVAAPAADQASEAAVAAGDDGHDADAADATEAGAPAVSADAEATPGDATVVAEAAAVAAEAPVEAAAEEAPRMVLLWRPGGRAGETRNQPGQRHRRGGDRAEGERQEGRPRRDGGRPHGDRPGGNRGRPEDGDKPREGRGKGGPRRANDNRGKPERGADNRGSDNRGNDKRSPENRGNDNRPRRDDRPVRKEKPFDPDSPFAALAALRDQLKK